MQAADEATLAAIVVNPADNALIAWIGGPTQPPTLRTLQSALAAAGVGDTVRVVDGTFTFTRTLTVPQRVTVTAANPSEIIAQWTVSGGGLSASNLTFSPTTNSRSVVTVTAAAVDPQLVGIEVANPANYTALIGINLNVASGVVVSGFTLDGGSPASGTSYGINVGGGTGVTVSDALISGVTRGIYTLPATSTTNGLKVSGSTIGAAVIGVSTGSATGVALTDVEITGTNTAGTTTGLDLATLTGAMVSGTTITGYSRGIFSTAGTIGPGLKVTGTSITTTTIGISTASTTGPALDDVTLTGANLAGTTTGLDLGASTGALVDTTGIAGYSRGIISLAGTTGAGPKVTSTTIAATTTGVNTASTTAPTFDDVTLTGTLVAGSTGINLDNSTAPEVKGTTTITRFARGIATAPANNHAGLKIVEGITRITELPTVGWGISLGSTTGARLKDVVLQGVWTAGQAGNSVGIDTHRAAGVVIEGPDISGFASGGIFATWIRESGSLIAGPKVTEGTIKDVPTGVYTANTTGTSVSDMDITLASGFAGGGGLGIAGHEAADVSIADVTVTGYENPQDFRRGSASIRFYYSDGIDVERANLVNGANGFYWDMTSDVTVNDSTVTGTEWYGTYTEAVTGYKVSNTTFTNNAGVANLTINPTDAPPLDRVEVSSDIEFVNNTMTDNLQGVYLPLGARDFTFLRNRVSGAPAQFVVNATPAHDVLIDHNQIDFTPVNATSAAVRVITSFADLVTKEFQSSGVRVLSNGFTGPGPFLQVGLPTATEDALDDIIEVSGNTFPRDSLAIRTYPNAEQPPAAAQEFAVTPLAAAALALEPIVAVDATDLGTRGANNWGAPCRARVTVGDTQSQTDPVVYDGEERGSTRRANLRCSTQWSAHRSPPWT